MLKGILLLVILVWMVGREKDNREVNDHGLEKRDRLIFVNQVIRPKVPG